MIILKEEKVLIKEVIERNILKIVKIIINLIVDLLTRYI